jgi:hypothetical protein
MELLRLLRNLLVTGAMLGLLGLAACSGGQPRPMPTFAPGECVTFDAGQSSTLDGVNVITEVGDDVDYNWLSIKIEPPTAKVFYQLRINEGNFEGDADVTTRHWGWFQPNHDDKSQYNLHSSSYSVYEYAKFVGVTVCLPSPNPDPSSP